MQSSAIQVYLRKKFWTGEGWYHFDHPNGDGYWQNTKMDSAIRVKPNGEVERPCSRQKDVKNHHQIFLHVKFYEKVVN